jgi:UDP:flavonoid glycosyltransferase YjiC (YdhE family)
MRITIFAAGSRGDIQPCILLGKGLQRAGFEVLLAAPQNFAAFIQEHELGFHPLRGDVQQIMASESGQSFMEEGGSNPLKQIAAMRKMLGPVAVQMAQDALEACRGAGALISLGVFATFAQTIAEARQIPLLLVEPTPLLPTGLFPAAGWPVQRSLGGLHNRLSGHAMLQVLWQWYRPFVNSFRQQLGLPPYGGASFYRILASTPLVGMYSEKVIPRPADWPETARVTGYCFAPAPAGWEPPAGLEAFLEAGDPPVYVGFGSMSGRRPESLARLVLEALRESGQRAVLLTGWGGMRAISAPESVFVVDAAPHAWLFPRMAAVVHHGGAGTTAEGLRAGRPTVIVPFAVDQAFWGKRVQDLGVGPAPIPQKALTASKLAQAIRQAVEQAEIKRHAADLGSAIRAEDGVEAAVKTIKEYLGV